MSFLYNRTGKLLLSAFLVIALNTSSKAQNNLAAGDIAIVSYQSDTDPTNTFLTTVLDFDDRFSIVVLKPGGLAAGTVIYITDRGWDGPNNIWLDEAYPPFTFGIGSEAVIKWVVPAGGIIQGKEVFFIGKYHDELPAGSEYYQWFAYSNEAGTIPLGAITNETPIVPTALPPPNGFTDGMSLFSAGDNILIFQTGPPAGAPTNYNDATRRFITAILANIRPTDVGVPTSYAAWDVAPNVQNESSIPPGLTNGTTCFLMSPGPLPHPTSPVPGTVEPDNGKFSNCALSLAGTCTAAQMAAIIYNITNWTYQNTVFAVGTSSSQCTYNVLSTNTAGAPSSTPTLCISTVLTNITHATTGATGIGAAVGLPAGVTAGFAANTITISGTPTASGTFNYSIPLTGGCGSINAAGTITVTPNKTAAAPSSTPTLCINTLLTNITHATTGATGIGAAVGLPAGVTAGFAANTITISGTPTASGTFNYSIPLTGGCGSINATGTITVNINTVLLTSAPATTTQTVNVGTAIANITYSTTGATGATVSPLPPGVNGVFSGGNLVTISGTPTSNVGSPFNYTVTLTGGCGTVTSSGTITVNAVAGPTTLAAGDLAFSGYKANDAVPDQFSFVLLKNISATTVIKFTDFGWRTNVAPGPQFINNGGAILESELTFTATSALTAGQEITIVGTTVSIVGAGSGTAVYTVGANFLVGNLSLASNGDQIFAYQGTFAVPVFIAGIHMNVYTGAPSTTTAGAWDGVLVAGSQDNNNSELPAGLVTGTNANWFTTEWDNVRFICGPDISTPALARAALNSANTTPANWQTNNTNPSGFTLPTGCNYLGILSAPVFTLQPPVTTTICEGTGTSFTIAATGATSYQWQVDNGGGFANLSNDATYSGVTTVTLTITNAPASLNGYIYRCVATNGFGSTNSNNATLIVTALPVNPTLLLKTPAAGTVADGTPVSATFNAGSGGSGGCTDDYRYTTNGGTSYTAYTPGTNISTTGLAAGTGFVFIEGRRAGCATCSGNYVVLASWYVTPLPAGATTLNAGDIGFTGYTSTSATDEFSFVLLRNIGPGTVINFTDNGWLSTNVFGVGESTATWTSNAAYPAGTEIKISGLTATLAAGGSAGTVAGAALSLLSTGDQVLAYRGTAASPTFISAIQMNVEAGSTNAAWDGAVVSGNASALPTGLTSGVNCIWIGLPGDFSSEHNNAKYGLCGLPAVAGSIVALRAALNNQANWTVDDNTPPAFVLPTGCPYLGIVASPVVTVHPAPATVCELSNTNFTITATGATNYQWQVDNGGGYVNVTNNANYSGATTPTLNLIATPLSFNGYIYHCIASNGGGSATSNPATLTVTALPVSPTLLLKTPATVSVTDGTPVSATFNAGSGGSGGCTDDYRYTTDGGTVYTAYTPGTNISTTGVAAGSGFVFIEGRRAGCATCSGSYTVLAAWRVSPLPGGATTLNAGDIAFSGYTSTSIPNDEFSFVLLRNIGPGTVINFTDNGWLSTNVFGVGESTATWTAPAGGLPGGTEIKISALTATRTGGGAAGTVTGVALSLLSTGDQVIAYRGTAASPTFISAIQMNVEPGSTVGAWDGVVVSGNASALPTGLTSGVNCIWIGTPGDIFSEHNNAKYGLCGLPAINGSLVALRAALNNQANWTVDDNTPPLFTLPTGCNYLSAICETISLTSPAGTDAQTLCINNPIINITYTTTVATGATFSGLPAGVTGAWAVSTVTISGSPSAGGVFNYTVTLTGGPCGGITANGTISSNDVTGGTVGSDQSVCTGGNPAAFTQTSASTGTGALTYQWQSSTTSCAAGFANIGGATGVTYDAPAGLLVTTYYRRVTTSTLNAVACTAISNCITVTTNPSTITVTNPAITTGFVGAPFSQTFTASGGIAPYTFATGSTVPGLTFSSAGVLSGTPTTPGTYNITVTATDAGGCMGTGLNYPLVISANACGSGSQVAQVGTASFAFPSNAINGFTIPAGTNRLLVVTVSDPGAATIGSVNFGASPMTYQAHKSDGFFAVDGIFTLPLGSGSSSSGNIVVAGSANKFMTATVFQFVNQVTPVAAKDSAQDPGPVPPASSTLTINSAANDLVFDIFDYFRQTTAANVAAFGAGQTPIINQGPMTLPFGFGYWSTSMKNGAAPNVAMSRTATANEAWIHVAMNIKAGVTVITVINPVVTTGSISVPFSQTFTASGGTAPYTFTTFSALPAGLTLSSAGVLSGTPTVTGTFNITVSATDANGCFGNGANYPLVISACTPSSITLGASPTVCRGTTSASLPYTATTGTPDTYSIDYDPAANAAGFVDVVNAVLPLSPITLTVPGAAAGGTYNATITVIKTVGGCISPAVSFTVSVNDVTGGTVAADQTICSGGDPAAFTQTVASTGTGALTYQWQSSTTSCAAGFSNIGGATATTYDAPAGLLVTTYYRRVTTSTLNAVACTANSNCVTVTVNNVTGGTVAADQTICSAGDPAAFTQTVASTGSGALTYQWQSSTTSCAAGFSNIGGATATTYDAPAGLLVTTYYRRVTTSTLNAVACTANSNCVTVTVNDVTGGTVATDQTICSAGDPAAFTQTVASTGSGALTYQWQSSTVSCAAGFSNIGGATGITYDAPAGLLVTTYYRRVTTSTLNAVACTANSNCVTVTVNPIPVGSALPQTICSGGTTSVTLSATTPAGGTTYSYTAAIQTTPTGGTITGQGSGTANPIAQTLTNSGTTFGVIRYTVTPSYTNAGVTCAGAAFTVDVTVNPTPVGSASPQTICSGGTTSVTLNSTTPAAGTTYSYTAAIQTTPTGGTITGQGSGTANPIAQTLTNSGTTFGVIRYTVTPSYTNAGVTCAGTAFTVDVTVNPIPVGSASPQTICSGGTTSVTLSANTPAAGTTYSYTAAIQTIPTGGTITGQGSGTANPIAQTLTNSGTTFGVIRYTVTPSYTNAGVTCAGAAFTVDVTVNPRPVGSASPQTICSGGTTSVTLSATTPAGGTTYSYTAAIQTTPTGGTITGQGSGTANPIAQTLTNSGTTFGVIRYTVTPSYTNAGVTCAGTAFTVDVTVNPIPVGSASPQTICSGGTTSVTLSSTTPAGGTTYSYTAAIQTTPTGGTITGQGSGTANPIAQTLTNTGTTFGVIRYTVTPSYTNAGVTCAGTAFTVDVTVNPIPVGSASPQTICSAGTTSVTLNSTTPAAGTTYSYTAAIQTTPTGGTITGQGSGTANPIAQTLTNTGTTFGVIRYTVTPSYTNAGVTCTGAAFTVDVTVNPRPVGSALPQTICSGFTTSVALSATTPAAGTTYSYTAAIQTTPTGGTITGQGSGTANPIAQNLTNTGTTAGVIRYTVTPSYTNAGVTCAGTAFTVDVTVNPTPDAVATPSSQTICSGNPITTIVVTGSVAGTVFNWTRDNTVSVTGIAASGAGNISGTLTNTTNAPVLVSFTIIPTANGCTGLTIVATVLVNPTPTAVATPSSQTICSGSGITTIVLTGNLGSSAVYNWTRDNTVTVTGIAASGSGNISGTLTNTTNAPVTVTFTIIPTANGCPGLPITATVLVNPTPNAVATPASQTICSASAITTIVLTGNVSGTVFNWTRDNTVAVTGIAASGSGNISGTLTNTTNAPVTVTFTITPTANGCPGPSITATVIVNPTPNAVATPASQTICSAATITTIALTGNVSGTVFNWTRDNTVAVTGIAASGSGDISGTLINTTNAPVTVTFTITPTANGCPGTPITATVLVNPTPNAVATPASQTICSASAITTIVLSGNVSGTTFNWTRDNTVAVTGIAASGSGNISGTLTNTTNAPVTVTFTITPTANGCPGPSITATVIVNPTPNAVATPASQTICSASAITTIALTGNVSGTAFNWTRDNTVAVTGIAASGSGNISGALTNTTNAPVTVTFTITPTANGCPGPSITATVIVNPTPNAVATPASQTICSASAITTIALTGNVSGTVFNWTRNNTGTVTGIAASGSGNISGSLTNTTNAPVTVTFTITPTANGCPGTPITASVLVNPRPDAFASPVSQTICSGAAITTIVLTGNVSGTTFNWTRDNTVAVTGIAASGSGNISGALTNTTNAPVLVTFTITPTANGCPGTPVTATVLVNPTPNAVATPASQTICSAATITTIVLSGNVAGTTFNWTRDNIVSVTGIAASGSGNISGALTNSTNVPITVTFTITPVANGCPGVSITATVLVNPTPNAFATPASQTICSGSAITTIQISGSVTGTTYNWTRDNTVAVTGIAASGSGNISGALTNTTNAPVTVTFTITPTANGCPGTPITVTVLVNPTPNAVAAPASQTICSGAAMTTIVLTGNVSGTVFNWTRDNTTTVGGIAGAGVGNISGTLINITTGPVTVTFTITPIANGCPGTPITATVIVNPKPTVTCPANIVINATPGTCGADVVYPAAVATGTPAPVITYSQASGTNFPVGVTTVTVTATNACGTATCTFTITVNDVRVPVITTPPVNTAVCVRNSATFSVVATNATSYQWQAGPAWGNIPGATSSTYTFITSQFMNNIVYRVAITGPCGTVTFSNPVTLTVNPLPLITLSSATTPELVPGRTVTIIAATNPSGGSYAWLFNGGPITGATASTLGPLSIDNLGRYNVIYTDLNGCVNTSSDFLVTGEYSITFWMYPNPTNNGKFQIRFNNQNGEVAKVRVYDPLGQVVFEQRVTTGPTTYSRIDVDLSNKSGGIYTVELLNGSDLRVGAKQELILR